MAALIGIIAVFAVAASYGAWLRWRRRSLRPGPPPAALPSALVAANPALVAANPAPVDLCPPQAGPLDQPVEIQRLTAPDPWQLHPSSHRLEDQPADWRATMRVHGASLLDSWVGEVSFVHGSFVGSDPLSLLSKLEQLSPGWHVRLRGPLSAAMKSASDRLARDAGNFEAPYARLFQDATSVPCSTFVWSSVNTHLARLAAAVGLTEHLVHRMKVRTDAGRLLLVGHSHAGQVFALLLQLLYEVEHAPLLLEVAERMDAARDALTRALDELRGVQLDVMTLGTPVRYGWPQAAKDHLVHVVNHRGTAPIAGRLDGAVWTRDGDYVQQWGIAGSDLPESSAERRKLDRKLEEVLGAGCQPRVWLENLEHRRRVHSLGKNLLVDYGDQDPRRRPNFLTTNFGHAIYTRRRSMAFLASLLSQFFGSTASDPGDLKTR